MKYYDISMEIVINECKIILIITDLMHLIQMRTMIRTIITFKEQWHNMTDNALQLKSMMILNNIDQIATDITQKPLIHQYMSNQFI